MVLVRKTSKVIFKPMHATPRFQQKLNQVRNLLASHVGKANVERYLKGSKPHQSYFRNWISVDTHATFVASEIESLLEVGAIRRWE